MKYSPPPPPSSLQDPSYRDDSVAHHKTQLNKLLPKPKKKNVHYLVVDKDAGTVDEDSGDTEEVLLLGDDSAAAREGEVRKRRRWG